MGGTKIFVLQMSQILKALIVGTVGIIIIGLLIYFFVPKDRQTPEEESALYYPGTYYSEIILHNDPVLVRVTVTKDKIVSLDLEDMDEVQSAFYPLFQPTMDDLSKEIVQTQTLNIVKTNDNAVTNEILVKAIRQALDQAEEKSLSR